MSVLITFCLPDDPPFGLFLTFSLILISYFERVAEWLRRLTRKPKVRTAVGSNPTLDSLVAVRNTSPGRPEPCEGNLVAVAGSCGGLMVKHPWPLLEISLSDFRGLATLNINTYLPSITSICFKNLLGPNSQSSGFRWMQAIISAPKTPVSKIENTVFS